MIKWLKKRILGFPYDHLNFKINIPIWSIRNPPAKVKNMLGKLKTEYIKLYSVYVRLTSCIIYFCNAYGLSKE